MTSRRAHNAAMPLLVRIVASLATATGLAGFLVTYFWVPGFLPTYGAGLLWSGLLALGGGALLAASRSHAGRRAGALQLAAAVIVVTALVASVYSGVALRLWVQTVNHFG